MVIDEVHSLLRGDRGGQTLCLIERLSRLAGSGSRLRSQYCRRVVVTVSHSSRELTNSRHFFPRGGQTLCLIERLSRLAGVNPRRIGLSATMGSLMRAFSGPM